MFVDNAADASLASGRYIICYVVFAPLLYNYNCRPLVKAGGGLTLSNEILRSVCSPCIGVLCLNNSVDLPICSIETVLLLSLSLDIDASEREEDSKNW